ncbi:peroxidase-related enzyme [Galbitalea soli]|uniref:Peroxidase-related enzyme n=1 Tax=Galbitalea soli TaxID=1268042 RepID=A0A7C9PPP0_9MICO|nr:peroxidase-related enzyme [Galbitalea soli]NEM92346.1 peroxidase-related enzyme [Galbitalea soli]NYJ31697.1 putative peroxidase-related enzyme [Galbitalea soli]
MSIIQTIPEDEATGVVAEIYAEETRATGYVPSHTRAMAMNPEAYRAWESLIRAIALPMGKRRYELVTLAAARGTRSQHCRLAHGARTLPLIEEEQLTRIALDHHDADLTPAEVAMMDFAERVSRDSSEMTEADSLALREHGFSDREIVDIALAAAARNYFSRAIQALAVDVDQPAGLSPALHDALLRMG